MSDEVTTNRSYPRPDPLNFVSYDVPKIIQTFNMIDADVASILVSLNGKAASSHTHSMSDVSGLTAALNGKASTSHTHAFDDLSDVDGTAAAPDGYVLGKLGGIWVPTAPASLLGSHTHSIGQITGLQTALNGKLDAAALAAASPKGTPVDADSLSMIDSEASNGLARVLWATIKSTLKAYYDTLYAAAAHNHNSDYAPIASGVQPGTIFDFAGTAAPTGYLLCYGQAVSRTTYAALFAAIGTAHGVGDGSTTFNLPDLRGRVAAGKDDMGGTAAGRLNVTMTGTRASTANGNITALSSTAGLSVGMRAFGTGIGAGAVITAITSGTALTLSVNNSATGSGTDIRFAVVDGVTLGDVGGSHLHKLVADQMPSHTHDVPYTITSGGIGSGSRFSDTALSSGARSTNGNLVLAEGGGQNHPNVQPTIVLNKIIKT